MKKKFFDIIGKCPEDVKVLYIPTAGIETDGAREGFAVCFQELSSMGIRYENILVYNLEFSQKTIREHIRRVLQILICLPDC